MSIIYPTHKLVEPTQLVEPTEDEKDESGPIDSSENEDKDGFQKLTTPIIEPEGTGDGLGFNRQALRDFKKRGVGFYGMTPMGR